MTAPDPQRALGSGLQTVFSGCDALADHTVALAADRWRRTAIAGGRAGRTELGLESSMSRV